METRLITRWNVYEAACPTRKVLDRIADKWTVLIVGRLAGGPRRFGELRRDIKGISPKVLTQKLRELERDGILTRKIYPSVPPKVEYRLTPLGQSLIGLLDALQVWSETHIETILAAQQSYDAQACAEVEEGES
jgi:DNA-binding HxlR family transcriptional regulator